MEITANTSSGACSSAELEKFRAQMRVDEPTFEFDKDYLRFILKYNGVQPRAKYFGMPGGRWSSIDRILNFTSVTEASHEDLIFHVHKNWIAIENRLEPGAFPFAALPGGDFLILEYKPQESSRVLYWYHEKSTEGSPFTELVAQGFADFLSELRVSPR